LRSIQRTLLVSLTAALVVGTAAVLFATYVNAYVQIARTFDEELVRIAEAAHLSEDWREPGRMRIPRTGFNLSVRAYDARGMMYFETAAPSMPDAAPKHYETGHAEVQAPGGPWRLYTHAEPDGVVQVAYPHATRRALARDLSLRMVLPELLFIPLLVLFMAWVVRRGLAPLRQVSQRVEDRDASRLDPLPTGDVPAELRPLIEEINALLGRLAASMAAQRRFVADAAHELRTPVAALSLQVQVAERAARPAERSAAFGELRKGTERATRMVEQLLRLAQLAPDALPPSFEPVDLASVAREVVGEMAARASAEGIDLGADAADAAPVLGARAELHSLITNLVDNALRYAPQGSEVTVRVSSEAAHVAMAVIDAGPGIAPAEREAVFERFQRRPGDSTPGTGLGLAIARAIVERHGGAISLEDALPRGLAARVHLPRLTAP
jgi:two-component system OmpR family sensor kinase